MGNYTDWGKTTMKLGWLLLLFGELAKRRVRPFVSEEWHPLDECVAARKLRLLVLKEEWSWREKYAHQASRIASGAEKKCL